MQAISKIQLLSHLLEFLAMMAIPVHTSIGQIVMNHFMAHDVAELTFSKVVIVCHHNDRIVKRMVKPTSLGVFEVSASILGVHQLKLWEQPPLFRSVIVNPYYD